jgi:hypothetical protein
MNDVVNRGNIAESMRSLFSPELAIRAEENQNEPRIRVYSGDNFVAGLRQLEDGRYKAYYNDADARVETEDFDNLQDAVDFLKDGLAGEFPVQQNNEPATPATPNPAFRRALEVGGQITDPAEAEGVQVVRQKVLNITRSYSAIRQPEQTWFDDQDGRRNWVSAGKNLEGKWEVRDGSLQFNGNPLIGTFDDRNTAEMVAMNRIANGGDVANPPQEPTPTPANPVDQVEVGEDVYEFEPDSDGNISVVNENGDVLYRVKRESEAPGGGQIDWYVAQDANGEQVEGINGSDSQSDVVDSLRAYLANRGNEPQNPVEPKPAGTPEAFVPDSTRKVLPSEVGNISTLIDRDGVTRKVDRVGDITQFPDESESDYGSYFIGTDFDGDYGVKYVVRSWPSSRLISVGPDRETAEADAINLITGNTNPKAPEEPQKTPTAPSAQPSDTSVASMTLGGKEITRRRHADGSSEYYNDGDEVGRIERNADGGYDSVDNWSGEVTTFDNEPDALAHQEELLALYARNGFMDRTPPNDDGGESSGGPSDPPPSGPNDGNGGNPPAPTNNPPALPPEANPANDPDFIPPAGIPMINGDGTGKVNVGGGNMGQPDDIRDVVLEKDPNAVMRSFQAKYFGDYNPGVYWENPDGTVAMWNTQRDGEAPRNWTPWDNEPVGPNGDPQFIFPNPNDPNGGQRIPEPGRPPVDPDAFVPTAPSTPSAPAPRAPRAPRAPQGRPRVNKVQPGDRFLRFKPRRIREGANDSTTYWDVYDKKSGKIIGAAKTRQIAEGIVNGTRDEKGKLIDFTTPVAPRPASTTVRPAGYRRTASGTGYFLENPNKPDAPVVRVDFDEQQNKWVSTMYANKQDAVENDPAKGIGTDEAGTRTEIEKLGYASVQKELDRRNPPAPAPTTPQAQPVEPQQTQHTRTDFGSKVFAVHDGDNEYGVAKKGQDGKWSVNVFPSPADGNDASKSFFDGSFDTPEEAEAAIRKAIADKRAAERPDNILQWQSASDGKAYLGLEGVAGYDADNSPVWGLSQMPFGAGWFVGAWNKKSDKDAGMPPVGTSRIDDEAQARRFAEDSLQAWLERNPPTA